MHIAQISTDEIRILTEVIKIVPINVIITKGNCKGLIGKLVGIEETAFGDRFHIQTPYGNIITDRNVIKPIEIGGNYMPFRSLEFDLGEIKDVKFINQLPKFDKNEIKDVRYNDPATIVFWKDGTKTVVKCQKDKGDTYNPELGLAMCIIKKMCDNKGNYNDVFNKWLPKE